MKLLKPNQQKFQDFRHGDAFTCLLFKIALEKIIRDSRIDTIDIVAGDVDVTSRQLNTLRESFLSFSNAKTMCLMINVSNTKLIVASLNERQRNIDQNYTIGD